MRIRLMTDIPDDLIFRKIKNQVKSHGKFHNPEIGSQMAAGIADPVKVTRSALQNASSIAAMVLTTESVVADKKEPAAAAPAAPGMGGDMGMY